MKNDQRENTIIFYGRPSIHRNAFSLVVNSLKLFSDMIDSENAKIWKIYSLGEKHRDIKLSNGMLINSLGKCSLDEYADIVPYEDVGGKLVLSETKIEAPTLVMKKSYEIDEKNLFMLFKKDHSFAKTLFAGDYIYTEDGMVCFFDWNYIDKEEGLRARLTAYAKAHLGECCMSFGFDKGNNALSATVPKRKM